MVKKARIANDFFCTLRWYSAKKPCQHDLSLRTAQRYYLAIFLQRIFTEFCPGRTWSWIFVWNAPAPSCLARFCVLGKHWSLELEKFVCSEMDVNSRKISLYVEKKCISFWRVAIHKKWTEELYLIGHAISRFTTRLKLDTWKPWRFWEVQQ